MEIPSEWKVHYVVNLQAPGTGEPCSPSALGGAGRGPRDWMPQHPRARGFSLQHSSTSCRAASSPVRVEGGQLDPSLSKARTRRRGIMLGVPFCFALAGPSRLPPSRSGDCAATLPAARRSASPYLLAVGSPLPAKASHVRRPGCACPSCSPFLQDGLCILVGT